MITASHNPPEYNGVKIIEPDGTEMGDEETIRLGRAAVRSFNTGQTLESGWNRGDRLSIWSTNIFMLLPASLKKILEEE